MGIVDAQVHIWGANTPERPWPTDRHPPHRAVALGADELLGHMDEGGVDGVVLVPPSWEGDRNDLALEAARAHPRRFAVMGRFDPDAPGAREQVAGWRKQPGMLGMRFTFHTPALLPPLVDGRMDWLWAAAEREGVPLMVLAHHRHAHLIDGVAERHPGLRLVMDHLGLRNDQKDEAAFADLDRLLALAKRPNVAVKVTALPSYTADSYPFRRLHPYIRRVHDAFGPRRMFWGTDWSRLPCTWRQGVTMWTEEMAFLSADDLDWIMGRGVREWLGWTS
ncbi:MAG: amidohydrolase [Rhodospirillales bacterium]|nr:MAG: amidohydrolase [Rhodospirillales bacterium]